MADPCPTRRRAVVLGAAGFIGHNLAEALVERGFDLLLFDRKHSCHWPAAARVLLGDAAAPPAALFDAMDGAFVFHLVGSTRPSASTRAVADEISSGIGLTATLLERSRGLDCRWIFASSGGTVYGEAQTPIISEHHPTYPISSYGIAKLAAEKYFHLYHTLHGTEYVIARLSNPFGPFQSPAKGQGLVAALFSRLQRGADIEIWGSGETVRDYLYIADAVEALVSLAESGIAGRTYNVGTGIGTSINELVDRVAEILGVIPSILRGPSRRIDVQRNVLDVGRIRQDIGWIPAHSLQNGLLKTRTWIEQSNRVIKDMRHYERG